MERDRGRDSVCVCLSCLNARPCSLGFGSTNFTLFTGIIVLLYINNCYWIINLKPSRYYPHNNSRSHNKDRVIFIIYYKMIKSINLIVT